ncbi:protein ROOT HAIR DEFECTIVE 3 homolog 1-like [Rhododendron vialii]|uniref:protein ROOT HAIR DEFECTIVE 3 homolog 1-like n=1 Tax=Rhododendron vialii TaxID=182163 RepID=UPI00265F33E9|nr:protein ROOT HAIR DEFECTIVE 3 homolog 1-like [Rhododendron vialii]
MDNHHHHHHRGTGNSERGRGRNGYSCGGGRGAGSGGQTQFGGRHWARLANRSRGRLRQNGGSYRPQQQSGGQMGQVGGSYMPQQQQTGVQMGRGVRPLNVEPVEVDGSDGFGRGGGGGEAWVVEWKPRRQQQNGGRGVGPTRGEAVEVNRSGGHGSGRDSYGLHTQGTTQSQPRALPEKGNECSETHLIEQDGTLNGVEFDKFLQKVNLAACGLNYAVVSIMGPQSSGKSTLLNHLFGTKFKEMDGLNQRSKTTQGIWLARCAGIEPCTLVMDVEGSDGGERGEDDTAFEKRSGLFALAVSHVVLINMFQTCIGLENGASKPLWKNVLEGVLRLFSPRKTTLMFVIRDFVRTPLEVLELCLRKDIQKIWDSIPKPEGHNRTPLSTFFNVEVVGLPNYLEREEPFKEQVYNLRQRFIHSIAPGGLAGDRRDTIRGSDFSLSAQEIWKTIKDDRTLDLPKHMVMVATIRCGEIVDKKLKAFVANEERRQLEERAQTNPTPGFGKKYSSIIKSCLHEYDVETAYFDEGVRSEKRKHLEEKLMPLVQSAFQFILANIGSRTLKEFKKAFDNALNNGKDFTVAANECQQACMKSFDDRCADVIVEQANCNTFEVQEKLQREIILHTLQVHLDKKPSVATPEWENGLKGFVGGCLVGGLVGSLGAAGAAGALLYNRPDLTKAALDGLARALIAANRAGLPQAALSAILRNFKFAPK